MATLKTQPNDSDVGEFIASVVPQQKQEDCQRVLSLMQEVTGAKPIMWGESIVGFGRYHYTYKSGHSGSWFLCGFSPRKQALTLYIMPGFSEFGHILDKLGKIKHSKSCLYIKNLSDIDLEVLRELLEASVVWLKKHYDVE